MSEKCRVCNNCTQATNAKPLFDDPQNIFVRDIELLTGDWLKYEPELPAYLCLHCEKDLKAAAAFREKCIRTQRLLRNEKLLADSDVDEKDTIAEALSDGKFTFEHSIKDEQETQNDFDNAEQQQLEVAIDPINICDAHEVDSSISQQPALLSKTHNKAKKPLTRCRNLTEGHAAQLKRLRRRRDYICDQCGKHFTDSSNFKLHLLRHTGVKDFQCKTCDEKFYTPHLLKRHERIHKGLLVYSCQYCDQKFKYSSKRIDHERRYHTFERPFQCGHCEKRFVSSTERKDHELVHTGVRKYYCALCNQRFLRSDHLAQHQRSKIHRNNEQNKNNTQNST